MMGQIGAGPDGRGGLDRSRGQMGVSGVGPDGG